MSAIRASVARDYRKQELEANLAVVRARVAAAAIAAGRDPSEVGLVVVTKTRPAEDLRLLAALGVRTVGENYVQEASAKVGAIADLDLDWHFLGQLQSNKAAGVARFASLVHSVDRLSLIAALGRAATGTGRTLGCLVQVNLDGKAGRGGAAPVDLPRLAKAVAAQPGLKLAGLMALAPLGVVPERAFAELPAHAQLIRSVSPAAGIVSAGMSQDLEAAVASGATLVRVGAAIFGARTRP